MNKRLIHSIAAFMIAALIVSVTGLALNRHTCVVTGYTGVSVVSSAHPDEDPNCPHHNHEGEHKEEAHSCCAEKSCDSGSKIDEPDDCCSNFTQLVSVDSTSVISKKDIKIALYAYVVTFIDNYGLSDKIDKLKQYTRSVKEALAAPIVGLIRILRIINPSRQDSPEAA